MRKYILLLIVTFGLFSCENFLDVKPEGEILGDELFSTTEGVEDALYGVYSNLGITALYGQALTYYLPDMLAAYYNMEGIYSGNTYNLVNFKYTAENGPQLFFNNIWTRMYENISYTNNILQNLKGKENSFRYYNFYKGEALALRAFMHFELCNCFAPAYREETVDKPAIPYCLTYEPLVYPFETVGKVYEKVIADLKTAEGLLTAEDEFMNQVASGGRPGTPGAPLFLTQRQYHLNLYAVQGLLARVYVMKNDLDSAMIYANKVIESKKFEFADKTMIANEYASKISVKETLWGVKGQQGWESEMRDCFDKASSIPNDGVLLPLNGFYILYGWYGPEGMEVDWGYNQLYEVPNQGTGEQDFRKGWFKKHKNATVTHTHFYKIYDREEQTSAVQGINMIRLPEMYLIMVEGLLKKGQFAEAKTYLDEYTGSRGFIYREGDAVLDMDLVNKEFRKEFFGEGRTWFNMKRQNQPINSCQNWMMSTPGSDAVYVWPIPDDEFEYREGGKEGVYNPEEKEEVKPN